MAGDRDARAKAAEKEAGGVQAAALELLLCSWLSCFHPHGQVPRCATLQLVVAIMSSTCQAAPCLEVGCSCSSKDTQRQKWLCSVCLVQQTGCCEQRHSSVC